MWVKLRRIFVSGLLAILPIVITIYIFLLLYRLMKAIVAPLGGLLHGALGKQLPWLSRDIWNTIIGIVVTVLIIMLIGAVTRHYLGRAFQAYFERLLHAIPVLRAIYKATKQVTDAVLNPESLAFKRVVLLEYPRKGAYSVGFVTSENIGQIHGSLGGRALAVFVPTPPYILNGTMVIIPESEVIYLDLSVEEGIKMLVSMGIALPEKQKEESDAES